MEWKSDMDGGLEVNIFDLQNISRWEYMERVMENINLAEVSIIHNNCIFYRL